MIYRYVVDINGQASEYVKGLNPEAEFFSYFRHQRYFNDSSAALKYSKRWWLNPPRRTNILLSSKAVSAEEFAVMYSTYRFILVSNRYVRPKYQLFPLKEDIAFNHNLFPRCLIQYYQNHWIPVENISAELLAKIRLLVVYFVDFIEKPEPTKVNPEITQLSAIRNLSESFTHVQDLRIDVIMVVKYPLGAKRILDLPEQLSEFRNIKNFEARVKIGLAGEAKAFYDSGSDYESGDEGDYFRALELEGVLHFERISRILTKCHQDFEGD